MSYRLPLLILLILITTTATSAQWGNGLPEDRVRLSLSDNDRRDGKERFIFSVTGGLTLNVGRNNENWWEPIVPLTGTFRTSRLIPVGTMAFNLGLQSGYYTAAAREKTDDLSGVPVKLLIAIDIVNSANFRLSLDNLIGAEYQIFGESSVNPHYSAALSMHWFFLKKAGIHLTVSAGQNFTADTSSFGGSQALVSMQAGLAFRFFSR